MQNFLGVCQLSVVPLRSTPSHSSEMTSQLIFGDSYEVLERQDAWLKIQKKDDSYTGWISANQWTPAGDFLGEELKKERQFLTREPSTMILKGPHKEPLYLPAGCVLPFYTDGRFQINDEIYVMTSSNVYIPNEQDFAVDVQEMAKLFLNTPYLWGGRTHFGIDCSGFAQMVFKMLGINLKRDAWQQAEQGELVDFLVESKAGDLAFFDNEEGKITHVGIMLNNSQIIHASGRVKIDRIDNQGIFASDQNKYTHQLRIIKRFVY